jgi:hypothetical protein
MVNLVSLNSKKSVIIHTASHRKLPNRLTDALAGM